MPRRCQRGAAVVDFVLVVVVLVPVFLGVLQVALVLFVRNTVTAAASEGARYAATLGHEPADGVDRTRSQISGVLAGRYARDITARPVVLDGLKVLIASPSDTTSLRGAVEEALHEWNGDRSEAAQVVLLPRRWETNAVPELGASDGQSVINSQLVADADIVIGIFHATLGRRTPRAASGTAEELIESDEAGKAVHVYFSAMPIPQDHERDQFAALQEFKKDLQDRGLYGSFDTPDSLKAQVRRAVERDIAALVTSEPVLRQNEGSGARLVAHYRADERIIIRNSGDVVAESVVPELTAPADGDTPAMWGIDEPFVIAPGGEVVIPLLMHANVSPTVRLRLQWQEGDEAKEATQSLSLL